MGVYVGGASSAKTTVTEPQGGTLPSYDTNASFIGGGTVGYQLENR